MTNNLDLPFIVQCFSDQKQVELVELTKLIMFALSRINCACLEKAIEVLSLSSSQALVVCVRMLTHIDREIDGWMDVCKGVQIELTRLGMHARTLVILFFSFPTRRISIFVTSITHSKTTASEDCVIESPDRSEHCSLFMFCL